jgi:hypothetical protein
MLALSAVVAYGADEIAVGVNLADNYFNYPKLNIDKRAGQNLWPNYSFGEYYKKAIPADIAAKDCKLLKLIDNDHFYPGSDIQSHFAIAVNSGASSKFPDNKPPGFSPQITPSTCLLLGQSGISHSLFWQTGEILHKENAEEIQ